MGIHQSGEDYLESILKLRERRGTVRAIDVAGDLGYSKPSVSVAMKKLREAGYILVDSAGMIVLTPEGEVIAQKTWEKHKTLTEFFVRLGVDPAQAETDACKVEHDLSDETFEKLLRHAQGANPAP